MSQKIVSQLDAAGVFIGATVADADPLEPGSFLVPGGAVDAAPPEVPPGHVARWAGEWVFEPVPVEPVQPPPAPPTHAQLVAQTLAATRVERQPIISVLDGLQSSALAKGDSATALTIETVKQGLRDITKTDLSACTTAEEMRAAIMGAYAALVQANPAVALAFKGVIA